MVKEPFSRFACSMLIHASRQNCICVREACAVDTHHPSVTVVAACVTQRLSACERRFAKRGACSGGWGVGMQHAGGARGGRVVSCVRAACAGLTHHPSVTVVAASVTQCL